MSAPVDVLFVGGGLANGLAAYRLRQTRPDLSFLIIEAGPSLGGNHTWSFHAADVSDGNRDWLAPFVGRSWEGTSVAFPSHRRVLPGRYLSVPSARFNDVLGDALRGGVRLNARVERLTLTGATLADGETIAARCVVDGRGWPAWAREDLAYQKFLGLELTLSAPHGLERPVIMDATVPQTDGFRFFYALPWDATHVLLEDTRYSDTPELDETAVRAAILAHTAALKWRVVEVGRAESAALPIPLSGAPPPFEPGVAVSGARAGLFHMTTGYSLPEAARFADAFASRTSFDGPSVAAWSHAWAQRHWRGQRFFRLLNRLLFRAARPDERRGVLEAFYRRDARFIARFYAGRMSGFDRVRLFAGRPPVGLGAAWRALRD